MLLSFTEIDIIGNRLIPMYKFWFPMISIFAKDSTLEFTGGVLNLSSNFKVGIVLKLIINMRNVYSLATLQFIREETRYNVVMRNYQRLIFLEEKIKFQSKSCRNNDTHPWRFVKIIQNVLHIKHGHLLLKIYHFK